MWIYFYWRHTLRSAKISAGWRSMQIAICKSNGVLARVSAGSIAVECCSSRLRRSMNFQIKSKGAWCLKIWYLEVVHWRPSTRKRAELKLRDCLTKSHTSSFPSRIPSTQSHNLTTKNKNLRYQHFLNALFCKSFSERISSPVGLVCFS